MRIDDGIAAQAVPYVLLAWLVSAVGLFILGYMLGKSDAAEDLSAKPPVGLAVPAKLSPALKKTEKQSVPVKGGQVRVYAPEAKVRLSMPWLTDNPAKQVLAAHQVAADDHPQTVTTVLDTDTGDSQTYVTRDPLPWLARDARGEAGIYLGYKNGEPAARLLARQGVFQVKALHFGVLGSVDQPLSGPIEADWFAGAGVWARW